MRVIGVDIGGTFTDLILYDTASGSVHVHKVPSTPGEPERAGRWWWEDPAVKECGLHPGKNHGAAKVFATVKDLAVSG